jgi:hypothetical protein
MLLELKGLQVQGQVPYQLLLLGYLLPYPTEAVAVAAVAVVMTLHRLVEILVEFKEAQVPIRVALVVLAALVGHSLMGLCHLHPTVLLELLEAGLAVAVVAAVAVVLYLVLLKQSMPTVVLVVLVAAGRYLFMLNKEMVGC